MQNVAVFWKKGLPKERDECWFLMTDLTYPVMRLTELYGRRMTIEELFRDEKNRRHGWALRNTQITRPDRFDRLLLILTLAYWLLTGIGLLALRRYPPGIWCSNNRPGACAVFFIGQKMVRRLQLTAAQALSALLHAILVEAGNWGLANPKAGRIVPPHRARELDLCGTRTGTCMQRSRAATLPSRLAAAWVVLAIMLLGVALFGVWRAPDRINHDCALYLQEAELLLDGAVPYRDFVELNPPLVIYLNVPTVFLARFLDISPIVVFHSLVIVLLALSAMEMRWLLGKGRLGFSLGGRGLVLLAWAALYFIVDGRGDTGQREQLFVLLYVPFLFLRILRHRGGAVSGWFAAMLGVQAGIGVALKPYFLLIAIGVEMVLLWRSRRGKTVWSLENFALATVVAAYALHWLFVPAAMREAFFGRWLPMIWRGYGAYNVSYREVAGSIIGSPLSLAAVAAALLAAFVAVRSSARWRDPLAALAALAGMALLAIFLQQKGWSYHRIPLDAAGLLCLAVLAGKWPKRGWLLSAHSAHLVTAAILCLLIAACATDRATARTEPPDFVALQRIVQTHSAPGDRVLIVASSVRPAYPMLLQLGRKPGSRYLCSFPVAFFYAEEKRGQVQFAGTAQRRAPTRSVGRRTNWTCPLFSTTYRDYADASDGERQFLDELADDVAQLQPRLVIIHDRPGWLGLPDGFNMFDYLEQAGWAKRALDNYQELPAPRGWKVFGQRR